MKKDDKASISLQKVICVSVILLFVMGITVFAVNSKVTNVKIILSNGYEMTVLTSKTKVSEILDENHIILLPNELVTPSLENNILDNKTIRIYENTEDVQVISEVVQTSGDSAQQNIENSSQISAEKLLAENYGSIVEKIVTEQIVIPYETTTKDVSTGKANKREVVVKKGVDGLKKVTSKIKYKNDVEIEKGETGIRKGATTNGRPLICKSNGNRHTYIAKTYKRQLFFIIDNFVIKRHFIFLR